MVTEATSFISEILDLQFLNVGSLCCICVILCLCSMFMQAIHDISSLGGDLCPPPQKKMT